MRYSNFLRNKQGKDTLLVVFQAMKDTVEKMYAKPYDFYNFLKEDTLCDKLYIRDPMSWWYQFGVEGVGNSIPEVADFLREEMKPYAKVIMVGASMGGFAAILFSRLLNSDICLAFSPQTFIDPASARYLEGQYWFYNLLQGIYPKLSTHRYLDLMPLFRVEDPAYIPPTKSASTQYVLFYGDIIKSDTPHCLRMANLPNFHVYQIPDCDHFTAFKLKDTGTLKRLYQNVVSNAPQPESLEALLAQESHLIKTVPSAQEWFELGRESLIASIRYALQDQQPNLSLSGI